MIPWNFIDLALWPHTHTLTLSLHNISLFYTNTLILSLWHISLSFNFTRTEHTHTHTHSLSPSLFYTLDYDVHTIFLELRDKLKSAETARQRLIEAFKKTSQEFREACSQITGNMTFNRFYDSASLCFIKIIVLALVHFSPHIHYGSPYNLYLTIPN